MSAALGHGDDEHGHGDRPAHLAHHFDNLQQQESSAKLGMWVFLATEILMFCGLFLAYFWVRSRYPEMVMEAHEHLDKVMGGINTVVLIFSSLTMALAVRAAQLGKRQQVNVMLIVTILCGAAFMVVKYFEYTGKFGHGIFPGAGFEMHVAAAEGGVMVQEAWYGGYQLFFSVYFLMTGLHGIHVLIGMGLMVWLLVKNMHGQFTPQYYTPIENTGLYWHLVDLIWIFLFPLLYLVR